MRFTLHIIVAVTAIFGPDLSTSLELPEVENCIPENELFKPFHAYPSRYVISGTGSTSAVSSHVGFNVTCDPTIYATGGCRYSMKVENCVRVDEGLTGDRFDLDMLRHPIYFSMANGKIGKLAAHQGEPPHILNLKRGIISTILVKNSSDLVQKFQLRTDVQGVCPAQYRKSGSVITMTKKMADCDFPSKADWSLSPWSLLRNMNFLQKTAIDSKVHCQYSKDQVLPSVKCSEEHTMWLRLTDNTGSYYQTTIFQEFQALEAKPFTGHPKAVDSGDFQLVDIQYEHEKDEQPVKNPDNLQTKAISLLEELVINAEEPIDLDTTSRFEELVHLLRRSVDLKEMTLGLPSCWNSQKCRKHSASAAGYNDFKLQMAQTWRDALVQCNRPACFRGLRTLLTMSQNVLDNVITTNYLNMVFLSWVNLDVPSVDYFPEMLKICKLRPTRPCLLSLTAAVHEFWRRNKDKLNNELPDVFSDVVRYVSLPIGSNCVNTQTSTKEQIMVSLVAMANLGEVAEAALEDLPERLHTCATNRQIDWPTNVLAIQAQRRFRPTEAFHERLLAIFRDSSARQDLRVPAYEILQRKWGDEQLVREVAVILDDPGDSLNLKTFLVSSLKSTAKSRDPSVAKYAEAIRVAMDENPQKFLFNTGLYVSKHNEHHFRLSAPFLEPPEDGFGYSFSEAILRNSETFLPYSLKDTLQVELFGNTFDLYEVYANSRGMMKSYEVFLSYFFNMEKLNLTEATQSVVKVLNIAIGKQKQPEVIDKFSYPVDKSIVQNLIRIRRDRMSSLVKGFSGEHAAIFKLKILGDVLGFTTSDLFQEDIYDIIQSWIIPPLWPSDLPISTSRNLILEAAHHVPTLSGIPLKWTLDAMLILALKERKHFSYMEPHYASGFNFSSLATLRARMLLDFPEQSSFGVQTLSTSSSSFGADLKLMHSFKDKTLNISVELPRRPLQWVGVTRQHSVFQKSANEDLTRISEATGENQWCQRRLFPHTGTQWCLGSSGFRNRGRHASRKWLFVGQNSNWNLTTELDASHHRVFQFNVDINRGNDVIIENFGINLRAIDPKNHKKFVDIATYRHDWHKGLDEHRIDFNIPKIPHLSLVAVTRPTDLGYELRASATILLNRTFTVHYMKKNTEEQGSEAALRYRPTSGSLPIRAHPVEYHLVNITTPTDNYSWKYSLRKFPQTTVADLEFKCHSFRFEDAHWFQKLVPTDPGNKLQTLALGFHHESLYLTDDLSLPSLPHRSYNYVKTPLSILELETFSGSLPTKAWALGFNVTLRKLPSYQLLTFLNFSVASDIRDKEQTVYEARVRVPDCYLVAGVEHRHAAENELKSRFYLHKKNEQGQSLSIPSQASLEMDPIILDIDFDRKHTKAHKGNTEQVKYTILANLTYGDETAAAQHVLEHAEDFSRLTYKSFLESSSLMFRWETMGDANLLTPKASIQSSISIIPHGNVLATYMAAMTLSPDNTLGLQSSLDSKWYSSKSRISYQASAGKGLSLEVYANANSSIWGVGSMTLHHTMSKNTARTTFENQLLEFAFQGNNSNRARGTFQVKSKNLEYVPNVKGNMEYSRIKGGFLQLTLPDISRDVFLVYRMSPHGTEMSFVLCFDRQCKDATINPGTFLGKLLFTVVEGKDLTTTLIYNKQLSKLVKPLTKTRFATKRQDGNALPEINGESCPGELTIGQLLGPAFGRLQRDAGDIVLGFSAIPESLVPIGDRILGAVARVGTYALTESRLSKLLPTTQLQHLVEDHNLDRRLPEWIFWGVSSLLSGSLSVPGGRSEHTYSVTVPLPMTGWTFGTYPSRPNPAFYRILQPLTADQGPAAQIFHSTRYTRFALFVGRGTVYTFDGRLLHLEQTLSAGCAYLLSHDFEHQKFTVYFSNRQFHFLFADTRMVLGQGGAVSVNGTHMDLPFEHWDGDFRMTRKENLVELDTKYNLKVLCNVDALFCLFYTNAWKFNQLIGLLGNNNDDPGDDVKGLTDNLLFKDNYSCTNGPASYPAQFELTGSSKCSRKEQNLVVSEQSNDQLCSTFTDVSRFFGPRSPTFLCHDIVPSDNFLDLCKYCSRSPCATVKAYLALCGALEVPVDKAPVSCENCNGHEPGTEWTVEVTDKVEVIFLVDEAQGSRDILKGLEILANSIDTKFTEFGYSPVRFGIVGVRSGAEQHTLNSKLFGDVVDFRTHGLKTLTFTGPKDYGGSGFDAITFAANYYSLDPEAHHMFVLVTREDPTDIIYAKAMHRARMAMADQHLVLYVFSNYTSIAKRLFRFTAMGYTSGQKEANLADLADGQYSRLATSTSGALWQVSHLEEGSHQQQMYLDAVAEDMVNRGKQEVGQCRKCTCTSPNYHQVRSLCRVVSCPTPKENSR